MYELMSNFKEIFAIAMLVIVFVVSRKVVIENMNMGGIPATMLSAAVALLSVLGLFG
jgi:hypothetical protein